MSWSRGLLEERLPPLSRRAGGSKPPLVPAPGKQSPRSWGGLAALFFSVSAAEARVCNWLAWLDGNSLCQMRLLDWFPQPAWPEMLPASPTRVIPRVVLLQPKHLCEPTSPLPCPTWVSPRQSQAPLRLTLGVRDSSDSKPAKEARSQTGQQ